MLYRQLPQESSGSITERRDLFLTTLIQPLRDSQKCCVAVLREQLLPSRY